jgi:16S rRNA (guanine966-N2)-methyltransferase
MRIIAGRLGGRNFSSPLGHRTRPMSDKIRGALFNTLGDINGLSVLDAFSGSGAIAFEAASRGANSIVAIDSDKNAQNSIISSIQELGLSKKIKLIKASTNAWLSTTDQTFDIIICDPPYNDIQAPLLLKVSKRVNEGGIVVLSLPPLAGFRLPAVYNLATYKNYGDAELFFYKLEGV